MLDEINNLSIRKASSDTVLIDNKHCSTWEEILSCIGIKSSSYTYHTCSGEDHHYITIICGKYRKQMPETKQMCDATKQEIYDFLIEAATIYLDLSGQDQREVMAFNSQTITKEA